MAIVFESFESVKVDGVSAGSFSDCVANYSARRIELAAACKTFHEQLASAHKTALDTKEAELTAARTTIAELQADLTVATNQLETVTTARNSLLGQLAESSDALALANSSLALANQTTEAIQARLQRLLTELPFNPREISVGAFKARLFSVLETEDVVRLYAAQPDSTLEQIAGTITNWDHAFPIRLDSPELVNPLGYLVSINLLTVAEVANLRRDCTRAEAFIAPI